MKSIKLAVALGVAAAVTGIAAHAGDHPRHSTGHQRFDSGMQAVSTQAKRGQPGHGWRYFADAREGRAVVISPGGDYFYSHGEGLVLVFKATGTA